MKDANEPISRRSFLIVGAGGTITGLMLNSCSPPPGAAWRFFTTREAALVDAVADRIIPQDQHPGGRWAEVTRFIDRQLASYYRHLQPRYREGLQALEETSLRLQGRSFTELDPEAQDSLLESLEHDQCPEGIWVAETSGSFFFLIKDHCMQGYYGNPRHGGNRDFVGYGTVGLPFPQLLGRVRG